MDSAPGEDGITSRFLLTFWKMYSFRWMYMKYLNFTRFSDKYKGKNNTGVMVIKNKKSQSIDYEKKRKLTKINKDSNIGNGKVWSNRLKKIVLSKILPKNQFICQEDVNIIDEIKELKDINMHLMNGKKEKDGTILSIDFNNAFRSVSLKWLNIVMEKFGIPMEFIDWFKRMYKNLGIIIVINKCKSERIAIERGLMEGHPASMGGFVIAMVPLMNVMESVMEGLVVEGKNHKIKMFADDLKGFIKSLDEITAIEKIIEKFEKISGVILHRDPAREKCQALPFGKHKEFKNWDYWPWITKKETIKVVGALFSNKENIDTINMNLAVKNFYMELQKSYGIRGTIFQKAYLVNTYMFSKLWYLAQNFKMENKVMDNVLKKALEFIYSGENERPVRAINFRSLKKGGLGLINPSVKSKTFYIINRMDTLVSAFLKGEKGPEIKWMEKEIQVIIDNNLIQENTKSIYEKLLEKLIMRNGSYIPSRNEKRVDGIKWKASWYNVSSVRGLSPEEKCFAWKITQDMLDVGVRKHKKDSIKDCKRMVDNRKICGKLETVKHRLIECKNVEDTYNKCKRILIKFLGKELTDEQILCLSFTHKNPKVKMASVWFAVKFLYEIFLSNTKVDSDSCLKLLVDIIQELKWNINNKIMLRRGYEYQSLIQLLLQQSST